MAELHPYQLKAIDSILKKKKCALYLGMGLGKTVISLSAITKLLDEFTINKILIIAPLRVTNHVWHTEIQKWDHLKHLTWSIVTGNEKERLKALKQKADIYLVNRENVLWLYLHKFTNWDMIILDESSSFKSPTSKRFKALRKFKYEYMVQLTGTPSPNGLLDLWSQIYLLDQGTRLGKTMYDYKHKYFISDFRGYNFTPIEPKVIYNAIKDIALSMQTEDYLILPPKINVWTSVELDEENQEIYLELEKEFTALIKDKEITAFNAGTLTNKLLQFCNGAIYDENKNIIEVHKAKLEALNEIIEDNPDENLIVAYNYQSDLKRLLNRFSHAQVLDKKGINISRWNEKKIKLLLAHPASSGKGLNLQEGGNIVIWFGLTWNLEDYLQFNSRLYRQGQMKPVIINHIIAGNCMDGRLMKALENKDLNQQSLFNALTSNKG